MADEAKVSILLEADLDEEQAKKEAERLAEITQKQVEKRRLIWQAKIEQVQLEKDLEDLREKLKKYKAERKTDFEFEARLDIHAVEKELSRTKTGIKELEDEIKDLENQKLTGVEKQVESIGTASTKSAGLVENLISKFAGFFAISKVFSYVVNTFNTFQKAQKTIVQETGASGEKLKQLTNDMLEVQGRVNQSEGEIAEAVGELNTRLGLSGEELQNMTEQYLKFAYVTGQDGKEAIAENVKLFNQRGVSTNQQIEYLDKLALAGQKTGVNVGTLTENLTTNAEILKQMGFNLNESIALLSNFESAGVEVSTTLQAMKVGLANIVSEGKAPAEALEEVANKIKNATSSTEGMSIAFEVFGKRGGVAMYNAIRQGTLNIDDMIKSLEEAGGTVDETAKNMETFGEFLSRKWNGIMADFIQRNNEGFQSFRELIGYISEATQPVTDFFESWENALVRVIKREAEFVYENGELKVVLNERGKEIERNIKIQEKLNQVSDNYKNTLDNAITAINNLDATSIDDSATQAEFEASKQKALEAAEAFRIALTAKLQYTEASSHYADNLYKTGKMTLEKRNEIVVANNQLTRELQQQRKNLENELKRIDNLKFTGKSGGGGSGGSGSGKSSKNVKSKKEELEALRNLELQAIYDSELSEEEKYKKYLEIYDKYKQDIIDAEGKTYDELQKEAEEYFKKQEEAVKGEIKYYEDLEKVQSKVDDSIDKHAKNIAKLGDEWTNVKDKAKDSLREVNNSLKELDEKFSNDLVDRYNKVKEEVLKARGKEGASWIMDYASLDFLQNYNSPTINGLDIADAIEYKKLAIELADLEATLTQEQKEQAEIQADLTETEKKRLEYEKERAVLVEKSKMLEAISSSGDWTEQAKVRYKDASKETLEYFDDEKEQRVAITDFKNEEYARDVLDNQEKLAQKKQDLDTALEEELKAYGDQVLDIKKQYETDTKNYKTQLEEKKKAFAQYVKDMNALAAQLSSKASHNAYGGNLAEGMVSRVGENGPEQVIARQSSYVQPRNQVQNNSTVYNNSNLSINGMEIGNFNNIDDLLDELRNRLTYRH